MAAVYRIGERMMDRACGHRWVDKTGLRLTAPFTYTLDIEGEPERHVRVTLTFDPSRSVVDIQVSADFGFQMTLYITEDPTPVIERFSSEALA